GCAGGVAAGAGCAAGACPGACCASAGNESSAAAETMMSLMGVVLLVGTRTPPRRARTIGLGAYGRTGSMADPFAQIDRGMLEWRGEPYGASREGVPLQVWLPAGGPATGLILAAIHGNEPETTVALSAALRSVEPAARRAAVVLCANPDGTL